MAGLPGRDPAGRRENRLAGHRGGRASGRQAGRGPERLETEFGPTNVALHAVAVAVELAESGEAVRRAAPIHPDGLSVERRARLLIDLARAYGQRRDTARAVTTLTQAYDLAPERVQYHPLVRDLVRRDRRRP